MTLLSVVKDVCAAVGVNVPTSVFSGIATNRTMQEMLSLANEMAQRIAYDQRDWTVLRNISLTTIVGGSGMPFFPLPVNYKRMLLTSEVWRSSNTMSPMRFIPDTNDWLQRRQRPVEGWHSGEWTIIGGDLYITPTIAADETGWFVYLDKNCINLGGGGVSDTFQNDNDSFRLDERLLKLGMIMQWKANKGNAYAEDIGALHAMNFLP